MNITVVTTIYKQRGSIFDFYSETEKQYQTDKYNGDVISGCRNLLNDFRKSKLIITNDMLSIKKLYLNGNLVAMLEPRFIINDEMFESWSDCIALNNNPYLSLDDIKIVKQLTHYSRQNIINILSK